MPIIQAGRQAGKLGKVFQAEGDARTQGGSKAVCALEDTSTEV